MRHAIVVAVLTQALLCAARAGEAQVIVGRVIDPGTGTAIVAADLQLIDQEGIIRARSLTDTIGKFRLVAPIPGRFSVRAGSLGYLAMQTDVVELGRGVEIELELRLASAGVLLEPVRVIATRTYRIGRLSEYYDRAEWAHKTGFGHVIMRDEIDRLSPFSMATLLQRVPSRRGCAMRYLLDGLPVTLEDLNQSVRPAEVEGVEIYRGVSEVPPQYQTARNSTCGLVLVWTRIDVEGMRPFSWKRLFVGVGAAGLLYLLMKNR